MEDKDSKLGLLNQLWLSRLSSLLLDVLDQFLDGILERSSGIIDLVDNQDVLAQEVGVAQRGKVQPLGARDLSTRHLLWASWLGGKSLVERETDGLDGDVGRPGLLEERAENARGDVAAAADGDEERRVEFLEDLGGRGLAHFVHLWGDVSVNWYTHANLGKQVHFEGVVW